MIIAGCQLDMDSQVSKYVLFVPILRMKIKKVFYKVNMFLIKSGTKLKSNKENGHDSCWGINLFLHISGWSGRDYLEDYHPMGRMIGVICARLTMNFNRNIIRL